MEVEEVFTGQSMGQASHGLQSKKTRETEKNTWATGQRRGGRRRGRVEESGKGTQGVEGLLPLPLLSLPVAPRKHWLSRSPRGDRVMACVPAEPRQKPEDVLGTLRSPRCLHREDGRTLSLT